MAKEVARMVEAMMVAVATAVAMEAARGTGTALSHTEGGRLI